MADNQYFSEESLQQEQNAQPAIVPDSEKKLHAASLGLGIAGIVVGVLLIPIIGLGLSVAAITLANKNKLVAKTTPGLICGILGIVGSIGMWIYSALVIVPQVTQAIGG